MDGVLLEKTSPQITANSPCPCGKAAYVLDRIAGYPVLPMLPTLPAAATGGKGADQVPRVGMQETDKAVTLYVEMPGVDPNSVQIDQEGLTVHISGKRTAAGACAFAFSTRVIVPDGLGPATKTFTNGLLTVEFPRKRRKP